ncbi:hypothetical protein [Streptomyces colonosanans]|uniref:Uncharacterized protein n=1 Tax=Streptomyces colonosanans TaxID=1428652 RepID=A0A1S2Q8E0_9ACTN|nr:hypothetical protein [Streptomyces colonosanans]OIK01495.1 hypothetical protein BIV24_00150 [Streptomyces colonosanans]
MSGYTRLKPEVAGGLGEHTMMDTTVHPPVVTHLHFEVADWLGDCLVQTFPCFLVTTSVGDRLASSGLSGFVPAAAEVTASDLFQDISPNGVLPDLRWLQVTGSAGEDDFGLDEKGQLVVSDQALALLRAGGLQHCRMEEF